jgi:hypothetical protein
VVFHQKARSATLFSLLKKKWREWLNATLHHFARPGRCPLGNDAKENDDPKHHRPLVAEASFQKWPKCTCTAPKPPQKHHIRNGARVMQKVKK